MKPELTHYPLFHRAGQVRKAAKIGIAGALKTLTVRCVDAVTAAPIADAELVIVFNRKKGIGLKDIRTDAAGNYTTALPASQKIIDSIICAPLAGYWPNHVTAVVVGAGNVSVQVAVTSIAADHRDALDHLTAAATPGDGQGVKVAVVDSGVSRAPASISSKD